MYHEDVDLSLRLRLAGGRLGVEPTAIVDHDYEFAKGPDKWRALERNRWATIVRCYPGRLLFVLAPALLATELALLIVAAAGGWLPQKLRGTAEALRRLPGLLRERRAIQATRAIPAGEFARWLTPDLDSPYLGRAGRLSPLRWALRAYWRAALTAAGGTAVAVSGTSRRGACAKRSLVDVVVPDYASASWPSTGARGAAVRARRSLADDDLRAARAGRGRRARGARRARRAALDAARVAHRAAQGADEQQRHGEDAEQGEHPVRPRADPVGAEERGAVEHGGQQAGERERLGALELEREVVPVGSPPAYALLARAAASALP